MLVLFETPAGFALFKVLNEGKLSKVEDLGKDFSTADSAKQIVKLKAFSKFENTSEALEAATLLIEGKASKGLRKFLRVHCENETLAVADSKLGNMIKEKLKIDCLHNNAVMELIRGVRNHLAELISGLAVQDMAPMSLGLSHSLSRFKLKFSADKVDTMIVQAIGLLDDLDKELNTYAMRVREWYGWHFPELTKIIQDNIHYAKSVKLMGDRINAAALDFSEILQEEVEAAVKEASVISMGTEIGELDLANIRELCDQVLSLSEYRAQLFDYLKSRMNTIAPNLTALVGELVGARLIAHGGSLMNLAKQPGSTVQILGAEKALFRALKTKHATPKYGLIYHASLIGQAAPKLKGKISRSLAAKAALAIRCDALGEPQDNSLGLESRLKLEARLRNLEGKELGRFAGSAKGKPKIESYDNDRKKGSGGLITPAKTYNASADSVIGQLSKSAIDEDTPELAITDKKKEKKEKKEKKKKEEKNEEDATLQPDGDAGEEPEHDVVKKEKKKKKNSADDDDNLDAGEKKKKRKKHADQEESPELPIKKKGKTKKNDS
ncbi:PREDICTED: probable nucleolar protein 5-1 [Lupinus angustifolius]|nr:PREDICTED: probable nucleolar protein 5-1 [Lupinus angustifolius]XP_019454204.1 PREDICTED: probable nucleolar protein 5-1 [Lupinus angustifolius]